MAEKWPERGRDGQTLLVMAGNGRKWQEMAGECKKWPGNVENGQGRPEMAGDSRKWPERAHESMSFSGGEGL